MNIRSLCSSLTITFINIIIVLSVFFLVTIQASHAAVLQLTPDTGVYQIGQQYSVRVVVNSQGQSINAAEGTLSFEGVTPVSVSAAGSIFNLWAEEPVIRGNSVVFSGGVPSGFNGSSGTIFTVTVRANTAGTHRIRFQQGSVLAADGRGTNVLSNMSGGSYTIQAAQSTPEPDRVEFVPVQNTPAAPNITSDTHGNGEWSSTTEAVLRWSVPQGVTQIRTLVSSASSAVPNEVQDSLINSITLRELTDGISYFHIQFRNENGWGRVATFALRVATKAPQDVSISLPEDSDLTSISQQLLVTVGDYTAPPERVLVRINNLEPKEFTLSGTATSTIDLPELIPGYYTIIAEVLDAAGNSTVSSTSFTIRAFEMPSLEKIPDSIQSDIIPAFRGTTRASSTVTGRLKNLSTEEEFILTTSSDETGVFTLMPVRNLSRGVYVLEVSAADSTGAASELFVSNRFIIEDPGYVRFGTVAISILSIAIPILGLILLLLFIVIYFVRKLRTFIGGVRKESSEAHSVLIDETVRLQHVIEEAKKSIKKSRKGKDLTKAEESALQTIEDELLAAKKKIEKEIVDVEHMVDKK